MKHYIGKNYTDIVKSRKKKHDLPKVGVLNRIIDINKLQKEIDNLLGDTKGKPISYNEKTDMASTEHNYDLKDSKGETFIQNYGESYKLYSHIGFQSLSDEALNVLDNYGDISKLSPRDRSRGMRDTSSQYYHPLYDERNYTKSTPHCKNYINTVINGFESQSCRSSLVVLHPGKFLSPHFDIGPEYVVRLQLPVFTNEKSILGVKCKDGWEEYHLPADGRIYFINSAWEHYVYNKGNESRYQIRICLHDQFDLNHVQEVKYTNVVPEPVFPTNDLLDQSLTELFSSN